MAVRHRVTFPALMGGRNSTMSELLVKKSPDGPLETPSSLNCDFGKIGGVGKRLGKVQQGGDVSTPEQLTQTTADNSADIADGDWTAWAGVFAVGGSNFSPADITLKLYSDGGSGTAHVEIWTDSSGLGSLVAGAVSDTQAIANTASSNDYTFTFPTPQTLTASTDYWIVVKLNVTSGSAGLGISYTTGASQNAYAFTGSSEPTVSGDFVQLIDDNDFYYVMNGVTVSATTQGLFDFEADISGTRTQRVMTHNGGSIYAKDGSNWRQIHTGLATGQDNLSAYSVVNNINFSTDFGNNGVRAWDGVLRDKGGGDYTESTMDAGYRAGFTLNTSAGAIPVGWYSVMAVTTLKSGGYRAKHLNVDLTGGAAQIDVDGILVDAVYGEFHWDIDSTATTWFMAQAPGATATEDDLTGKIYYKISTSDSTLSTNPDANSISSFDITAVANLTSGNTLVDEYGKEQGYFTSQIDMPTFAYLTAGQGFLVGAEKDTTRVYVASVFEPNIWSTIGGTEGTFYEVGKNDNQSIRGIFYQGSGFYAFKDAGVFYYSFTGDSTLAFQESEMHSNGMAPISHWSVVETPIGVIFPSRTGMARIEGNNIIPLDSEKIGDLFDTALDTSFNLSVMQYTTAANNANQRWVLFGVSTNGATTRDRVLVYNYELGNWSIREGVSANYFATVQDSDGFPELWSGDYSGRIFKHDSGTNDDGSTISWEWSTPWLSFGDNDSWKRLEKLTMKGEVQASGTLTVEIYKDYETSVHRTVTFDMTDTRFNNWLEESANTRGRVFKMTFKNSELDVPVQIDGFGVYVQNLGPQR